MPHEPPPTGFPATRHAPLFGLFSLVYGVSQITTGVEIRRAGQTPDKVLDHAA